MRQSIARSLQKRMLKRLADKGKIRIFGVRKQTFDNPHVRHDVHADQRK
ncbi:MAG: hypothetical protein ACI841_002604 [Planctomycetota bacterium]|jgi:hypothetical protein